jgi:hypothetical protein
VVAFVHSVSVTGLLSPPLLPFVGELPALLLSSLLEQPATARAMLAPSATTAALRIVLVMKMKPLCRR